VKVRKGLLAWMLVLLVVLAMRPEGAFAYSYGNPNEEVVAENYKLFAGKLNLDPPDFQAATDVYKQVQVEIDQHMGPEPSKSILGALAAKDKATALDAYRKTLVLNIARRLESIEKDFKNYEINKLLLAKALATYEALAPQVQEQAIDQKLRTSFETALSALGNPGLFGVGVKEADPALFKVQKDEILNSLKTQFQLESLDVGHFQPGEAAKETAPSQEKNQGGTSELRNWLPLIGIAVVLGAIVFFATRRRRRG